MLRHKQLTLSLLYISLFVYMTACTKKDIPESILVFTANGDINIKLEAFRQQVGTTLNSSTGVTGGRREINWDAVPSDLINNPLPGDFFNPTETDAPMSRKRGLFYSAVGGEFIATNNGFASVNSESSNQFTAFSGANSFANISSSLWDAEFRVAGSADLATVKGFGLVFSDVDKENNAFIEFFNEQKSLGRFYAPAKNSISNFSFVGVYFKEELITKVRIGHEATILNNKDISNGGTSDLVAFDDFIYSEPVKK